MLTDIEKVEAAAPAELRRFLPRETVLTQRVIIVPTMPRAPVAPPRAHQVLLTNGATVLLRSILPSDAPRLRAAFHALSAESRYRRFLGHMTDLSPQMLDYLCAVDGWDHVAVVALLPDAGGRERLVGVARFIRTRDEIDGAEVAITVADELHGRGLGTHLLDVLTRAAVVRGIRRFTAYALRDNKAIRRVLAHLGPTTEHDDDTVELKLASRR